MTQGAGRSAFRREMGSCRQGGAHSAGDRRAFIFSLEAAFSLTLVLFAAAYLFAFAPQKQGAGWLLSCADAAEALSESRAFQSQGKLDRAVGEASALFGGCLEAETEGAQSCACDGKAVEEGCFGSGEAVSFSSPAWLDGRLQNARVRCGKGIA